MRLEVARALWHKVGCKRTMPDPKIVSAKRHLASRVSSRDVAKDIAVSLAALYRWIPASDQIDLKIVSKKVQ